MSEPLLAAKAVHKTYDLGHRALEVLRGVDLAVDAGEFLAGVPAKRVRWLHVAGHHVEAPDLRVDTHGADVSEPVWALLQQAYARFGAMPTVLERDFNIPPLAELARELKHIASIQRDARVRGHDTFRGPGMG